MKPITFNIELNGWKAWAAIVALVAVGFSAGLATTYARPAPYESADYVLVDDGRQCVYAALQEDRAGRTATVFRAYYRSEFDGPCPHHGESPVASGDVANPATWSVPTTRS